MIIKTLTEVKKLKELERLQALIEEMKLALLYLNFDVEATRREKITLQKEIDRLNSEQA